MFAELEAPVTRHRRIVLPDDDVQTTVPIDVGDRQALGVAGQGDAAVPGFERGEGAPAVVGQHHAQPAVHAPSLALRAEGVLRQDGVEIAIAVEIL